MKSELYFGKLKQNQKQRNKTIFNRPIYFLILLNCGYLKSTSAENSFLPSPQSSYMGLMWASLLHPISAHLGVTHIQLIWVPHGQAHLKSSHKTHIHLTWAPCGQTHLKPRHGTHIHPIWAPCGQTHLNPN